MNCRDIVGLFGKIGNVAEDRKLTYAERLQRIEELIGMIKAILSESEAADSRGLGGWRVIEAKDPVLVRDGVLRRGYYPWMDTVTRLEIGEGITEIEELALDNLPCLKELRLPSSLRILKSGFGGRYENSLKVTLERIELKAESEGLKFEDYIALREVVFPSTFKRIEYAMFSGCRSLEKIVLPDQLEEIGPMAFENCSNLRELDFPSGLKELGTGAFAGCRALEHLELPAGLRMIPQSCFKGCTGLRKIVFPDSLVELSGFEDCAQLEEVNLPEGLEAIGDSAFEHCKKLRLPAFPRGIRIVGERAFFGTPFDGKVVLPEAVGNLAADLHDYDSVEHVTLPEGVVSLAAVPCSYTSDVAIPSTLRDVRVEPKLTGREPSRQAWKCLFWGTDPRLVHNVKWLTGSTSYEPEGYPASDPVFKDVLALGRTLSDLHVPRDMRIQAFRRLFDPYAMFPCFSLKDTEVITESLTDHPSVRQWWALQGLPGGEDLRVTDANLLEPLRRINTQTGEGKKLYSALGKDSAAGLLMEFDLKGKPFTRIWFLEALRGAKTGILRGLYVQKREKVTKWLSLKGLLFYAVVHYTAKKALEILQLVEELEPGTVAQAADARGCTALWYSLYRRGGVSKEVIRALIDAGCDPTAKTRHLGLSWEEITEWGIGVGISASSYNIAEAGTF